MTVPFRISAPVAMLETVCWPVEPFDDESIPSLVVRSGDHNAIRRTGKLLVDAGLPVHQRCGSLAISSHPLNGLAVRLAVDAEWVNARRHSVLQPGNGVSGVIDFHGASLRWAHLNYTVRPWAAGALAASPYVRERWVIATLPVDLGTFEVLSTRCPQPACGKSLGWIYTRGIDTCEHCGTSLSESKSVLVPYELRAALKRASDLIHPDRSVNQAAAQTLPPALREVNRGDVFELAWLLGCVATNVEASSVVQPQELDPMMRLRAVALGFDLLDAWPKSTFEIIRSEVDNDRGDVILAMWLGYKKVLRKKGTFGVAGRLLAEAVDQLTSNAGMTALADGVGYMTAMQFSEAAGIQRSDLVKLRDAELLDAVVVRKTRERSYTLYPKSVAEELRSKLLTRLTLREAATRLGVSIDGIEALIAAGELEAEDDPILKILFVERHVTPRSVDLLYHRLDRRLLPAAEGPRRTLARALHGIPQSRKPWLAIVYAVLKGELELHRGGERQLLRSSKVPDTSLPAVRAMRSVQIPGEDLTPALINEEEARERLNCSWRQLRALTRDGTLQSSGKFTGQTFRTSQVDEIARARISASESSQRAMALSPRCVTALLHKGGLLHDRQWADRAPVEQVFAGYA